MTRSNPSFAFVGREVTEKNKIDILSNVLIQGKNRILPQLTELYCFLVFPEESELMWSFKRTLHVHRIIARSLRCSISRLLTLGAQHSLAYNKTVQKYMLYICPRVMYERAREVNIGKSSRNLPHADRILVIKIGVLAKTTFLDVEKTFLLSGVYLGHKLRLFAIFDFYSLS